MVSDDIEGIYRCPTPTGYYCIGDSRQSDLLVFCENSIGVVVNCGIALRGIAPADVGFASCFIDPARGGVAACEQE